MDLVTGKLLGGCEVLKVLVIREDEYNICRAFQVVAPLWKASKMASNSLLYIL